MHAELGKRLHADLHLIIVTLTALTLNEHKKTQTPTDMSGHLSQASNYQAGFCFALWEYTLKSI